MEATGLMTGVRAAGAEVRLSVVMGGIQLGMEAGRRAKQVWERGALPGWLLLPTGSRKGHSKPDHAWQLGEIHGPLGSRQTGDGQVAAPGFQAVFRYQATS